MIIIADQPGQLGNQIWSYAPFVVYGIKNNRKVFICGFEKHIESFPNLNKHSLVKIIDGKIRRRFFKKLSRSIFLNRLTKPQTSGELEKALRKKICLIRAWGSYRPENLLNENLKLVRTIWKTSSDLTIDSGGLRIGIHMRQGDYATWRGGKFYYTSEYYALKALQLEKELGQKATYFIASNTHPDELSKKLKNSYFINRASAYQDINLLAQCDFILAPPSTFSRWAAFYGQGPLIVLNGKNDENLLSKARIPTALMDASELEQ